jgi:DNA-binding transcriptional ArsR family regulator
MERADIVYRAIAHRTRRRILGLLTVRARSVKELTAAFELTQPAISQHLRELREADLVTSERVGLERHYRLTAAPIKAVFEWSSQYRRFFDPAGHAWEFVAADKDTKRKAAKGGRAHGR